MTIRTWLAAAVFLCALPSSTLVEASNRLIAYNRFQNIDLGGLPEIRSHDGWLETTLRAAPQTVSVGQAQFAGDVYNNSFGGPVLRVHAGDHVRIHLINAMPDAINLHFHGLRISPEGHADNMHTLVLPGQHYVYDFNIPRNHPPGLFWYHDHAPNAAEAHVTGGLSGALLIDGFSTQFQHLSKMPESLIVLKDWSMPGCEGDVLKTQLHCRVLSINGLADWHTTIAPNSSQLWRISNQGPNLILHLAAPGLTMRIIGRDGLPALDTPLVNAIDVMPASRLDVLVHAAAPGRYTVFAPGVLTGVGATLTAKRVVGYIDVAGPAPEDEEQSLVPPRQKDLRDHAVTGTRTVVFAENDAATVFTVDGKTFDPNRTDVRVPLGSLELWTIRNVTHDLHVFHIHQLGFQIVEVNGKKQDFAGFVDGVRVPEGGEVKLLIPFTDPLMVGHFMFHCHVLKHEDRGMMAMLEVYRPGLGRICKPKI